MAENNNASTQSIQPPPAPPLPPSRTANVFQKFIAPLSFTIGTRQQGNPAGQSAGVSPSTTTNRISRHLTSQTTRHRTSIPIAAVDVNKARSHAILAGQEILKTVHVHNGRMVEDFNLRSGIRTYVSAHAARPETASHRREYLPAKDVVWSKGDRYDTIIATAALNGRIALYDVSRVNSSRIELAWIHEHTGQVNKLDFDPTGGYLLLSGSQDKTVRLWDIREPQSVKRKQSFNIRQPVRDIRWSPTDVGEFALCTENGVVQRWDLRMPSGALLSINSAHDKACYAIDWHPDGRHLASGGFDKYVRVWDFKSENRRQKPAVELRTPQAILNVQWRPPCWSTDLVGKGYWQSAQLATSYTDNDPRIHVWDLRRPFLPFREYDFYNNRPTDIMWASEHFLWSVGSQGMFTQTDTRYTPLVHDDLTPSTVGHMPDGRFITFSDDGQLRDSADLNDPTIGLLRPPQDKLGGGVDDGTSRSFSDEDDEGLLTTSMLRRGSKSSRSARSQGNTPPTGNGFQYVVPLDRSVLDGNNVSNNAQVGIVSHVAGTSTEPEVVEFLIDHYARPMTLKERQQDPSQILDKLQQAFDRNANACDYVSLHRMAQSWRILGAVIVPELRDWADANRAERLEAKPLNTRPVQVLEALKDGKAAPPQLQLSKSKVMNNLFKGVAESERYRPDTEISSNTTTPTVRAYRASPIPSAPYHGTPHFNLNDSIEPIPPLPPSVVSAHSTAAAASQALLDPADDGSPASSPEQPFRSPPLAQRHKRTITDIPATTFDRNSQLLSPQVHTDRQTTPSPLLQPSPRMGIRKQEDRRAAIRDFRVPQRQPFTLDEPAPDSRYATNQRHDSSESFPMFSASTDSSHLTRSLGQSFDRHKDPQRGPRDSEEWQYIQANDEAEFSDASNKKNPVDLDDDRHAQSLDSEEDSLQENFPMDETSRLDFGLETTAEPVQSPAPSKPSAAVGVWNIEEPQLLSNQSQSETAASSGSGGVFAFEPAPNTQRPKIYTFNPMRRPVSKAEDAATQPSLIVQAMDDLDHEDITSKTYVYSDFRPIDFTVYEPQLPFAWSALPLVCHSIAFDIFEGMACAQFSVQVLMHLYPFFFDSRPKMSIQPGILPPDSLAERLMRPDLSYRIIEGLFLNHHLYLKKQGFFVAMAELRNTCTDLGLDRIFKSQETDQSVGASLTQDPYQLQVSCAHCCALMRPKAVICQSCGNARTSCPICLQLYPVRHEDQPNDAIPTQRSFFLWSFCQACGHGAHWHCMQQWMLQSDAQGECPTRDCGCDCGPGLVRQRRLARQLADAETTEMVRGGRGSSVTKKDPLRASHSPAVDKTRDSLRSLDNTARDSSADDRTRSRFGNNNHSSSSSRGGGRGSLSAVSVGSAASAGGGFSRGASTNTSFGRRVRLVTPGEEGEN